MTVTVSFGLDPVEESLRATTMPTPDLNRVAASQFCSPSDIGGEDDRALYVALRNFEMVRVAATGEHCMGVHLYHRHGQTYPLLTIWARRCWLRRCYLTLPVETTDHRLRVRLDYLFYGPLNEFLLEASDLSGILDSLELDVRKPPSPRVLPSEDVPKGTPIPIPNIIQQMDADVSTCPIGLRPRLLTNQAFMLVEMSNDSPPQAAQLYRAAIQRLDDALSLRPEHVHALHEKAYIFSRLRDYQSAFAAAQDAVRMDPDNPKFWMTWISIQLDAMTSSATPVPWCCEMDEIESEVDRLCTAFPNYPSVCFEKARLLILRNRPQSEWEACLDEAAARYRSLTTMPSGKPANSLDVVSTMLENTLLCCALAQRLSGSSAK